MLRTFALSAAPVLTSFAGFLADDKAPPPIQSRTIAECDSEIVRIAADEKGVNLLVATERYEARLWNVAKGAFAWTSEPFWKGATVDEETRKVLYSARAVDLSAKHAFVATGFVTPQCFAVETGTSTGGFMSSPADIGKLPVAALCDPRDRWVWMIVENGGIMRYAPTDGVRSYSRRTMKDGSQPRCATLDAELGAVAIGCSDGSVHFADMSSAKIDEDKVLRGAESPIAAIDFANKGVSLVTGNEKGEVVIWHVPSGKARKTIAASDAAIRAVAVHPKGKWFASGDEKGVVKVWSLDKGELVTTLSADGATKVNGLAFVDQGKGLAAALGGKNVVVWDVAKL